MVASLANILKAYYATRKIAAATTTITKSSPPPVLPRDDPFHCNSKAMAAATPTVAAPAKMEARVYSWDGKCGSPETSIVGWPAGWLAGWLLGRQTSEHLQPQPLRQ